MPAFTLSPVAAFDGEAVIPLAQAKAQLRLIEDDTSEDDLIAAFRDAAIDFVEQYTSKRLLAREHVWTGSFDGVRGLRLGVGPVGDISAFGYRLGDGTAGTVLPADIRIDPVTGALWPVEASAWPSDITVLPGSVSVTFMAGYAEGLCPPALIQAAVLLIGHFYRHREGVVTGTISGQIPFGVEALCQPYRAMVI